MKAQPKTIYAVEGKDTGEILEANNAPLIDTNRAELKDRANGYFGADSFTIAAFDRRRAAPKLRKH